MNKAEKIYKKLRVEELNLISQIAITRMNRIRLQEKEAELMKEFNKVAFKLKQYADTGIIVEVDKSRQEKLVGLLQKRLK